MDLLDIAIASKLSGSGGGGGSSDFSTATLTINWEYDFDDNAGSVANIYDDGEEASSMPNLNCISGAQNVFTVILYKGEAFAAFPMYTPKSVSGNISPVGGYFYIITGDCSVTFGA